MSSEKRAVQGRIWSQRPMMGVIILMCDFGSPDPWRKRYRKLAKFVRERYRICSHFEKMTWLILDPLVTASMVTHEVSEILLLDDYAAAFESELFSTRMLASSTTESSNAFERFDRIVP